MLVDDGDAVPLGFSRPVDRDFLAFLEDQAVVRPMNPAEYLDDGALPRAVLSCQRMHPAGAKTEVDVRQHLHGSEALRDPAQLDDGCHGAHGFDGKARHRRQEASLTVRRGAVSPRRRERELRRPRLRRRRGPG